MVFKLLYVWLNKCGIFPHRCNVVRRVKLFNRTLWHGGMLGFKLLLKKKKLSVFDFAEFWQHIQDTGKRFNIGRISRGN